MPSFPLIPAPHIQNLGPNLGLQVSACNSVPGRKRLHAASSPTGQEPLEAVVAGVSARVAQAAGLPEDLALGLGFQFGA